MNGAAISIPESMIDDRFEAVLRRLLDKPRMCRLFQRFYDAAKGVEVTFSDEQKTFFREGLRTYLAYTDEEHRAYYLVGFHLGMFWALTGLDLAKTRRSETPDELLDEMIFSSEEHRRKLKINHLFTDGLAASMTPEQKRADLDFWDNYNFYPDVSSICYRIGRHDGARYARSLNLIAVEPVLQAGHEATRLAA